MKKTIECRAGRSHGAAPVRRRRVAARDACVVTTRRGGIAYARSVSGNGGCRGRINRVTTDQRARA
ncbi:hypothetical protein WS50_08845 [Burkholderia territorii]|nr:hypothetical protein WS50_08845 [Burkholderia territorii]